MCFKSFFGKKKLIVGTYPFAAFLLESFSTENGTNGRILKIVWNLSIFQMKVMKNNSSSLDYCKRLLRRIPDAFTRFIDILIKTKQNNIVDLLLNTTLGKYHTRVAGWYNIPLNLQKRTRTLNFCSNENAQKFLRPWGRDMDEEGVVPLLYGINSAHFDFNMTLYFQNNSVDQKYSYKS